MDGNWVLDVKFQGHNIPLTGRLPAEKRDLSHRLPKKLDMHTKVKLTAIPKKGFFCKFVGKKCENMKMYMHTSDRALCANFTLDMMDFTLYLIPPVCLKGLQCLNRLRRSGASAESIKSLCTNRDGIIIGFIVTEVNTELEAQLEAKKKDMEELVSSAKALSKGFQDPMFEFDLLVDQLDTKSSAVQMCAKFVVKHQQLHTAIRDKLVKAMEESTTDKNRCNILFVMHEIFNTIRAAYPPESRNAKLKKSVLVQTLEPILFAFTEPFRHGKNIPKSVNDVFSYWRRWELRFSKPQGSREEDILTKEKLLNGEKDISDIDITTTGSNSGASDDITTSPSNPANLHVIPNTTPVAVSPSPVLDARITHFMNTHNLPTGGPWDVYLARTTTEELEELSEACALNSSYLRLNEWGAVDEKGGGGRRQGEYFLHQYLKVNMPHVLQHSLHDSSSVKRKSPGRDSSEILKEAFLCTWDVDQSAQKAVWDVDSDVVETVWKKMEHTKCNNISAFVFSKIRYTKTAKYAKIPEIDALLAVVRKIEDENLSGNEHCHRLACDLVNAFQLDLMAQKAAHNVVDINDLCKLVKEICQRCRDGFVANPSVHVVKLCHQLKAVVDPKKSYSTAMKSMLNRQMKLSTHFQNSQSRKGTKRARSSSNKSSSYSTSSSDEETEESAELVEVTDAELAALKRRIPKPPKLKFKKVDLSTIQFTETNKNGCVGVAISGIPNANRGLFNLSDHPWPAFSVVCIFGKRRITKEMHHDGLNKVARCGELGETFVVVNGVVRDVAKFHTQYGHRLRPFDGLVDAEGSVGGFPNDRVYEYAADVYWDASSFYNNCILVPGCILENPQDTTSPIILDQLYIVTWKEVAPREEFFLAYGTSYYEDEDDTKKDESDCNTKNAKGKTDGYRIRSARA